MEDFYTKISRRPLKDLAQFQSQATITEHNDQWDKTFDNSNDISIWGWREHWKRNIANNLKEFGYFHRDHSIKCFQNELLNKPCILVGAGCSLEGNIQYLKAAKEKGIAIISSSHSFMYLSDIGIKPDFVVQLDAGSQWGDYLKGDSKDIPLLVDVVSDTAPLKLWQGPIYFFSSAISSRTNACKFFRMERDRICPEDKLGTIIASGGHVGGAMLVIARTVMQSNRIIFVGYDYCFSPDKKFNPFDKAIDKSWIDENNGVHATDPIPEGQIEDILGNICETDGSYISFKNVLEYSIRLLKLETLSKGGDVEFINACEGGSLGAIPGGLLKWIQYLRLEDALIATK